MAAYYDPSKTYCLLAIVSRTTRILDRPENERFSALIPNFSGTDIGFSETGLSLTFNVDSFTDLVGGHAFGKDPNECDILLDDAQGSGIDGIHFRLRLDYTQKEPDLDVINCSHRGTQVGDGVLTIPGQRTRLYQGDVVRITAGSVALQLSYPFLDMSNPKVLSRWNELRMTAWSLFTPSLRNSLVPSNMRARYLEAEEDHIWQDACDPVLVTGTMTVALSKNKVKQRTGIAVVLKKLRDKHGSTREERQNMSETASMTRLRHANLVSAFRDTWPQGNVILVEHTAHGTISHFLAAHNASRFKEDAVMDVASQALSALSCLSRNGICHRDIKPSKIMVFRTDPPLFKLTDFGGEDLRDVRGYLSDRVEDDSITYVAPEIFERGHNASASKADVWSLGIVLWELLTGETPIPFCEDEVTYVSAFRAVLNWRPCGRELEGFGVSDEGTELVLRMCERDVRVRPDVEVLRADECFEYLDVVRGSEPCDLQDSVL